MADKNSSKFKIRFDDDNTGSLYDKPSEAPEADEIEGLQLKKLKRRINRIAFWIPCLLALLLLFAYLDIRKRFDDIHDAGTPNVLTLSKDLDSKFSSLSIRQARVEALLDEKVAAIQQVSARLEKELSQTEKTLAGVRSTTPDKQDLAAAVSAEVDKRITPVSADLQKIASELKALATDGKTLKDQLEKRFNSLAASVKELAAVSAALEKETRTLKQDAAVLTSSKVDKLSFDLAIRHEEKFYQQKLDELEKSLSRQIQAVRDQVNTLAEIKKGGGADRPAPGKRQAAVIAPAAPETEPAPLEPGKIVEQELRK